MSDETNERSARSFLYDRANLVTLAGLLCGVSSIYFSSLGDHVAATIALLAAAATPVRAEAAEEALAGAALDEDSVAAAAKLAAADIEPTGDIHGSTEYRKHLIEAMVRRAITAAASRAKEGT